MQSITPFLNTGAQFTLSGCHYEVAGVWKDQVRVAPMQGGTIRHLSFRALSDLVEQDQIRLTYRPPGAADCDRDASLSGLKSRQVEKLNRRLRWVRALHKRIPHAPCSQCAIADTVNEIAEELGESAVPGVSTLADWMKRWLKGSRSDAALMPALKPSRVKHAKLDPKVLEFIQGSTESVYLTRQRNPMSAVYSDVQVQIANYNVSAVHKLAMPSKETIRRIIHRIDIYQRDAARHGKSYARRKHRAAGKSFVATEPLEMCMADGQIMDVIVVEQPRRDGLPQQALGRPYLTVVIDVRTRCVLAALVTLAPFSGGTLLKAMAIAVVASPGHPHGIMTTLIVDNGSDYQDSGFIRFCAAIDVTIEPCPPRMPNGKAIVERFFRTINEDLIHKLPGSTFSNPIDRGDYDSQKFARLTLDDLRAHVDTWIQEVYHQRPHRSLGRAPIAVWNEEIEM